VIIPRFTCCFITEISIPAVLMKALLMHHTYIKSIRQTSNSPANDNS